MSPSLLVLWVHRADTATATSKILSLHSRCDAALRFLTFRIYGAHHQNAVVPQPVLSPAQGSTTWYSAQNKTLYTHGGMPSPSALILCVVCTHT